MTVFRCFEAKASWIPHASTVQAIYLSALVTENIRKQLIDPVWGTCHEVRMAGVLLEFNYSRLLLGLNLVTRVSEACGKELGPKAGKRARNAPNYGIQVLGGTDTPSVLRALGASWSSWLHWMSVGDTFDDVMSCDVPCVLVSGKFTTPSVAYIAPNSRLSMSVQPR